MYKVYKDDLIAKKDRIAFSRYDTYLSILDKKPHLLDMGEEAMTEVELFNKDDQWYFLTFIHTLIDGYDRVINHSQNLINNLNLLRNERVINHIPELTNLSALAWDMRRMVEDGATIIIIEHNMDVIKMADYVVDLGPEGGNKGGQIIAKGTPEQIAKVAESHTGRYLADLLRRDKDRQK